jgi:hypothetical protein
MDAETSKRFTSARVAQRRAELVHASCTEAATRDDDLRSRFIQGRIGMERAFLVAAIGLQPGGFAPILRC